MTREAPRREVEVPDGVPEELDVVNTVKAAKWLGISERHVRRMADQGRFPGAYQKTGMRYSHWLIPIKALKRVRARPKKP